MTGRRALRLRLPRTLFAETVALLFAAVLAAQAATWCYFMEEKEFAARKVHINHTLTRTASAVRLVDATPANLHNDSLAAASSKDFRFWLTRRPEAGDASANEEGAELGARLAADIGRSPDAVRVRIQRSETDGALPTGYAQAAMMLSVRVGDGSWLNAATYRPASNNQGWKMGAMSILATLLATAGAAVVIARRMARPLRDLAAAAERLGRGEAVAPLRQDCGPDEVRRAGRAFNRMGDRLHRFVQDRTRMLAAISHDLRTPITSLRLRAEMIEDGETRTRMLETLEELAATTEASLTFAREDAAAENTRLVDLASLVESICEDVAEIGKGAVACVQADKLPYPCRPTAIRRAVRNLVENAVAHGAGRVRIAVEPDRQAGEVLILVDDDGPGIAAPDLERVFDPFVRLEASRNRSTGGVGLGLSIARTVARGHGGDVTLSNRPGGGLRAAISLPLSDDLADTTRPAPAGKPLQPTAAHA